MLNKSKFEHKVAFYTLNLPPLTRDVVYSKFQKYRESKGDKKLSVENAHS